MSATQSTVVVLLVSSLAIVGCGKSREQGDLTSLSIAGHTTQLGATLKIAEAKDLYRKHGLNVSIKLVESSRESMAAMEAGQFDVVIGSLAAGSFNLIRQSDLLIIADGSRVVPSLVIRSDLSNGGTIRQLSDLRGHSIVTPRQGSSSYYALSRLLAAGSMTLADVTLKYLDESATLAALEAKQVDVAILNEPQATTAIKRGVGVRFDMSTIRKSFPVNGQQHMVIITRRDTSEQKAAPLRQFLRAYSEAAAIYEQARQHGSQRAEVVSIIAEYTRYDKSTIEDAEWPYVSPDGKPDADYIKAMHDYFVKEKLVDAPVDLAKAINLSLLPQTTK